MNPWNLENKLISTEFTINNGVIEIVPLTEEKAHIKGTLLHMKKEWLAMEDDWVIKRAYQVKGYDEALYVAKLHEVDKLPTYMVPCFNGKDEMSQCTMFCEHYGKGCIYEFLHQ